MKTITTIKQNDITSIQRCSHSNFKILESYMDLSVGHCSDCGSIIVEEMDNPLDEKSEWTRKVIDPFSVYLMLKNIAPTFEDHKNKRRENEVPT